MDELNEKPHDQQPTRLLLARALRRARGSLLWERLWPALASVAIVLGLFLAFSWAGPLADIAAARARNRPDHFRPAVDRRRRCRWRSCGCRASTTGCGASIAAAAKYTGRRRPFPITLLQTETIRWRRPSGRRMSSARCCPRARSKPAGRCRGCRCAIRWRCARSCPFWWWRRSSRRAASGSSVSPPPSTGTAWSRRRISGSTRGSRLRSTQDGRR